MNETIDLMKKHTSVRRFTEEPISEKDYAPSLTPVERHPAGRIFNLIRLSLFVVRKKAALFDLVPQKAIRQSSVFLLFIGDLNRAKKGVCLHTDTFYPQGVENILISSVDASLVAQNTLLAAESLGYGGVIIGLVRYASREIAELFNLPNYTYPIFGIALGKPAQHHTVKPRLPYEAVVFEEKYQEQDVSIIQTYNQVQADYAGNRATDTWSERLTAQFAKKPNLASQNLLQDKKLL